MGGLLHAEAPEVPWEDPGVQMGHVLQGAWTHASMASVWLLSGHRPQVTELEAELETLEEAKKILLFSMLWAAWAAGAASPVGSPRPDDISPFSLALSRVADAMILLAGQARKPS